MTEAVYNGYWIKPKDQRGKDDYDGVQILSISSCISPSGDYAKRKRRSFWKWIPTLFDTYGDGQSKSNDYFIKQIKPHLDFEINITRVENQPLSSEQAKNISLDQAGKHSLKILQGVGAITGNNAKTDPQVQYFFKEKKTVDISKL